MMTKWLSIWWYRYLFVRPDGYAKGYCSWISRLGCRIQGHPEGPIWYNPGGLEPNMRCKKCGDELG